VLLNQDKIHKTDAVTMTNQPIWTVENGSLFLVDLSSSSSNTSRKMLTFEVRDRDPLLPGKTECIGTVRIDVNQILDSYCTEERVEFSILSDVYQAAREGILSWDSGEEGDENPGKKSQPSEATSLIARKGEHKGRLGETKESKYAVSHSGDEATLALRFRRATQEDVHFIGNLRAGRLDLKDEKRGNGSTKGGKSKQQLSALMTEEEGNVGGAVGGLVDSVKFTLSASKGKGHKRKLRVKPRPDPTRPEQTRFLTEEEVIAATYSPSKQWIECGSGSHGRVYVEILHCDKLPNCDAGGGLAGNKTNAFVNIVYEDAAVQTDVLQNCLSPLWLPWTKRAFAFNRTHPLSSMYIGVFHYDVVNPLGHQGIGRIAINLQQMRAHHDYILKYNLHHSSVYSNRTPNGSITVRLRIDPGGSEKAFLLQTIQPLCQFEINVKKRKTQAIVKYTCYGHHVEDKFDINLLKSQANEMMELLQDVQYVVVDATKSLIFWRGQVMLGKADFPLYSLLAYIFCAYVVERPHLLPSLFFWFLFFVMSASYGHRRHHPSPWYRSKPISDYLSIIAKGKATPTVMSIQAGQGVKEIAALEEAWKSRIELDAMAASKRSEMQEKVTAVEEAVDNKKGAGPSVPQMDPLALLLPLQKKVEQAIYIPRAMKSIITWECSSISFVLTFGSLAIAVLLSVLPTAWLIYWFCRLAVHCFLGPHMKVVDIVLNPGSGLNDGSDRHRQEQNMVKNLAKEFHGRNKVARMKAEGEVKRAAMRKIRLGHLNVKVPSVNITRYCDYPLPTDSTAEPVTMASQKGWNHRLIFPGQNLYGQMISMQRIRKDMEEGIAKEECDVDELFHSHNEDQINDTSDSSPDELQQLANYKLQLANAKANLGRSIGSREEVEAVKKLELLVEEMSQISPGRDADSVDDSGRASISNEGVTPSQNVPEDRSGRGQGNESNPMRDRNSEFSDSGSSWPQDDDSGDRKDTTLDLAGSQENVPGDESVLSDDLQGVQITALSEEAINSNDLVNIDLKEEISQDQRDDDDLLKYDDPFATYSEEKRTLAMTATSDQSAPPAPKGKLRRLLRGRSMKSD